MTSAADKKELPLRVGAPIKLKFGDKTHDLAVVGWKSGYFILVEAPTFLSVKANMRTLPVMPCEAHLAAGGREIIFNSKVVNSFHNISPFLAIEYPKDFQAEPRRRTERKKMALPVTYFLREQGQEFEKSGTIRDLSHAGAMLGIPEPLRTDSAITIFSATEHGTLKNLEATVHNIRQNTCENEEPWLVGARFVNVSDANRMVLQKLNMLGAIELHGILKDLTRRRQER